MFSRECICDRFGCHFSTLSVCYFYVICVCSLCDSWDILDLSCSVGKRPFYTLVVGEEEGLHVYVSYYQVIDANMDL